MGVRKKTYELFIVRSPEGFGDAERSVELLIVLNSKAVEKSLHPGLFNFPQNERPPRSTAHLVFPSRRPARLKEGIFQRTGGQCLIFG